MTPHEMLIELIECTTALRHFECGKSGPCREQTLNGPSASREWCTRAGAVLDSLSDYIGEQLHQFYVNRMSTHMRIQYWETYDGQ